MIYNRNVVSEDTHYVSYHCRDSYCSSSSSSSLLFNRHLLSLIAPTPLNSGFIYVRHLYKETFIMTAIMYLGFAFVTSFLMSAAQAEAQLVDFEKHHGHKHHMSSKKHK